MERARRASAAAVHAAWEALRVYVSFCGPWKDRCLSTCSPRNLQSMWRSTTTVALLESSWIPSKAIHTSHPATPSHAPLAAPLAPLSPPPPSRTRSRPQRSGARAGTRFRKRASTRHWQAGPSARAAKVRASASATAFTPHVMPAVIVGLADDDEQASPQVSMYWHCRRPQEPPHVEYCVSHALWACP